MKYVWEAGFVLIGCAVGCVGTVIMILKSKTGQKAISNVVAEKVCDFIYGETGRIKSSSSASKVSYRNYRDS